MPDQTTQTKQSFKRYQCRHVFTEGRRCGSPCLRGEDFCYYHHRARRSAEMRVRDCSDREGPFELPSLEDRTGIQSAITEVLQRIAGCSLDHKRAGLLLYGLQIASINLSKPGHIEQHPTAVDGITEDLVLGSLAPRTVLAAPGEAIDETEETPEEEATVEAKTEPKDENRRPRSIAELKDGYYRALDRINRQIPQPQGGTPYVRDGRVVSKMMGEAEQSPKTPEPEPITLPSLHACQSSAEEWQEPFRFHSATTSPLPFCTPFPFHSLFHCHSAARRRNLLFPSPFPSCEPSKSESTLNTKRPRNRGASADPQQGSFRG